MVSSLELKLDRPRVRVVVRHVEVRDSPGPRSRKARTGGAPPDRNIEAEGPSSPFDTRAGLLAVMPSVLSEWAEPTYAASKPMIEFVPPMKRASQPPPPPVVLCMVSVGEVLVATARHDRPAEAGRPARRRRRRRRRRHRRRLPPVPASTGVAGGTSQSARPPAPAPRRLAGQERHRSPIGGQVIDLLAAPHGRHVRRVDALIDEVALDRVGPVRAQHEVRLAVARGIRETLEIHRPLLIVRLEPGRHAVERAARVLVELFGADLESDRHAGVLALGFARQRLAPAAPTS